MYVNIIITGYYFKYFDFYKKIVDETKLYNSITFNLFILSHKAKEDISIEIYNYLIEKNWHIIFQPNIGWDWGCHAQFMQWHLEQRLPTPDYLLFLHDDISIIKNGFIQEFLNKAQNGFKLIGNSKPFTIIKSFEKDYTDEAYILQKNGFEYENGKIEIVRGSAFFVTYNLAEQALSNLPYQKCGSINLANRSLRMFGAIVTHLVGNDKIGYLSDNHFRSEFISEEMRGEGISPFFFWKRFLFSKISAVLSYAEEVVSKHILKHTYSNKEKYSLKVNVTQNKYLQGYLNISIEKNCCSDISFEDLNSLFIQNKIVKVLTSLELVKDENLFSNHILDRVTKSQLPVDLLINVENSDKDELNEFLKRNKNLKIKVEIIPRRKGTKWVKRLYIKYPQENLRPN